jgi:ABC-type transport system involved in cytochrome bd biosynthesis fused ATPase/permease subunit
LELFRKQAQWRVYTALPFLLLRFTIKWMSDTKTSATPSSTSRHGKRVEDIDKLQATFVRARTSLVPCSVCFLLGAVLAGAGAYVATFLVACTIGLLVGFVLGIKFNRAEV